MFSSASNTNKFKLNKITSTSAEESVREDFSENKCSIKNEEVNFKSDENETRSIRTLQDETNRFNNSNIDIKPKKTLGLPHKGNISKSKSQIDPNTKPISDFFTIFQHGKSVNKFTK